jgi:hypothetical protein
VPKAMGSAVALSASAQGNGVSHGFSRSSDEVMNNTE